MICCLGCIQCLVTYLHLHGVAQPAENVGEKRIIDLKVLRVWADGIHHGAYRIHD